MAQSAHDWTTVQPENKWFILKKQKRIALWAVYISFGSMMMGFDFGIAGTAAAFPAFQQVMGIPYPSQPSGYLIPAYVHSAWSGVSTGGDVLGVMLSGWIMERIGRKKTVIIGDMLTAVGIGIQVAANDWKVFLAGRLINAIGFGIVFIVGPVWIGETVRPELRGMFLCLTNGMIVFGQFILSLTAYGVANIPGKWSYQTLVVFQFVFVAAIALPWPWFPESPYWLLRRDRDDDARVALQRVHGKRQDGLIEAEVDRIREMMKAADELAASLSLSGPPLLQVLKPPHLKRTLISMLPPLAQQFIGAAFVLGYITYFLSLLGIEEFFTVSVVLYCVMLLSNISAFPLIETAGRRWLLLTGMIFLTVTELVMGIMGVVGNAAALWVTLVCIFLWALVYQCTLGSVGFAIAGEISSAPVRAPTISLIGAMQGFSGWLIGFISPYMINPDAGNLGAKVGFVFAGLGLPMCILFWFFIPETKGLSFEIIDKLFTDGANPRQFRREGRLLTEAGYGLNMAEGSRDAKESEVTAIETELVSS